MDSVTFANRQYPTIYDYHEAIGLNSASITDEIKGKSNLVFDATVGTHDGYTFYVDRVLEKKNTAQTMAFDEGWVAGKDGHKETIAFDCMRVGDARRFDQLVSAGTEDGGLNDRVIAAQNMARSIIQKKGHSIIYGGQPASDGTVDGKEIPGLISYVSKISDLQKMREVYHEGIYAPFKGENGLTLDNQDGSEATDSTTVEANQASNMWASVYGIAWGKNGVFTTFPRYRGAGTGAYNFQIHRDNSAPYTDAYDGIEKMTWDDWYTADAFFGIGIKNRFCISAIRNIYLYHKSKADREDEMYRLEQNLISLRNFFNLGETGLTMKFYTSDEVLNQMESFQKGRVTLVGLTPDSNSGQWGKINNGTLQIASGIELCSDFAFTETESFISDKETW